MRNRGIKEIGEDWANGGLLKVCYHMLKHGHLFSLFSLHIGSSTQIYSSPEWHQITSFIPATHPCHLEYYKTQQHRKVCEIIWYFKNWSIYTSKC